MLFLHDGYSTHFSGTVQLDLSPVDFSYGGTSKSACMPLLQKIYVYIFNCYTKTGFILYKPLSKCAVDISSLPCKNDLIGGFQKVFILLLLCL